MRTAGERRRDLRTKLRYLRRDSGVSSRELALRMGVSQSTVSRVESGQRTPTPTEVRTWLDVLSVHDDVSGALVAESIGLTESPGVRVSRSHIGSSLRRPQAVMAQMEREAERIVEFSPAAICGLLQTGDYCRFIYRNVYRLPEDENAFVSARLQRQGRIARTSNNRILMMPLDLLMRPQLNSKQWMDQLHHLRAGLRTPGAEVGIVASSRHLPAPSVSGTLVDGHWGMADDFLQTTGFVDTPRLNLLAASLAKCQQEAEFGAAAEKLIDEAIDYCSRF